MTADRPFTITTWNLQGSHGVDVDQVAEHLRATGSDVVALQEVQRHQARKLARALQADTLGWAFKHWPLNTWPEGMALLGLGLPLRGVKGRALTARRRVTSWRRRIVLTARADKNGSPLTLVNVHLTPHQPGADDRNREVGTILSLSRSVADDAPYIIAGDFNAEPETAPIAQMRAAGLTTPEKGPTKWRGTPTDRPAEREIDYIWASPGLKVLEVSRPSPGDTNFAVFPTISDHLPVTVAFVPA